MGRFFHLDSPLMSGLSKLADLICLNIIALICCIPVFTIGASLTALYYVVLKIVRDEEGYVVRSYFKSFKQNFRQATIIWLLIMLVGAIVIGDFWIFIYSEIEFSQWMQIALLAVAFILLLSVMHVFPLLSRFDNTVRSTIRNSLFMGILHLPKTLLMMVCWLMPVLVTAYLPQLFSFVILLGVSGPAFCCALLYNKSFQKFEPEIEEVTSDEEWIAARQKQDVQERMALREAEEARKSTDLTDAETMKEEAAGEEKEGV